MWSLRPRRSKSRWARVGGRKSCSDPGQRCDSAQPIDLASRTSLGLDQLLGAARRVIREPPASQRPAGVPWAPEAQILLHVAGRLANERGTPHSAAQRKRGRTARPFQSLLCGRRGAAAAAAATDDTVTAAAVTARHLRPSPAVRSLDAIVEARLQTFLEQITRHLNGAFAALFRACGGVVVS